MAKHHSSIKGSKPCQLRLLTITAIVANMAMSLSFPRAARFTSKPMLQSASYAGCLRKRLSALSRFILSMEGERPSSVTNNQVSLPKHLSIAPVPHSLPSTGTSSLRPYFQRFWDMQHSLLRQRLTNLRSVPVVTRNGYDLSVMENRNNRMITQCFSSNEYRYIRMSLLDGNHKQVYTSVWYPRSSQLPIFACDLVQFGKMSSTSGQQRHLCFVDYQPVMVQQDDALTDQDQEVVRLTQAQQHELLQPIRDSFPLLQGEMSTRFYPQDAPYFSSHLLLGRHNVAPMPSSAVSSTTSTASELRATSTANSAAKPAVRQTKAESGYETGSDMVDDVHQAWQAYMGRHIDWTQQSLLVERQNDADLTRKRHTAYDDFSAKYDHALPMLGHMFGKELAHEFVHDILFPLSQS